MPKNLVQRFSHDTELGDIDHIIVGSGIGGLTAATWLAKAGHKVAIFERHYVAGGFTHSFKRKQGFHWNVGVHYVGNVSKTGSLRGMFDLLTDGQLEWTPLGDVYDQVRIGEQVYELRAGRENFRNQLVQYFPAEENSIDAYLDLLDKANKAASPFFAQKVFKPFLSKTLGYFMRRSYAPYSQRTTAEVLNEITRDKRLIAVLCAQCGNYGLAPKYSSFGAHAAVIGHFMDGGYYPVGGPDKLSEHALRNFTKHGGKVFINAAVSEIVTEGSRVSGIKIGERFIPCKSVISNAGVNNTFNHLVSDSARSICKFDLLEVRPSTGHLCLYIGLDRTAEELGLPKHNIWCYDHEDQSEVLDNVNVANAAERFAYLSFPSANDTEWSRTNPGTSTIQALTKANIEWFSEFEDKPWMKRGAAYEALKEQFKESMLQRLYSLFPQIEGHVVVTEVSTPLSTKHFSNYRSGEIYGLEHTPERFALPFLRPETKIKGLRLVGQDITLVGVSGAMLSGMLVAITILKWRVWRLIKEIGQYKKEALNSV